MGKPFAWSHSALNAFETCPKQFWHMRIQKSHKQGESDAMKYGKFVHKSIEDRILKGEELPLDLAYLDPHLEKYYNAPGVKLGEQQLAINTDYKPTGWFSDDVYCRAIIDYVVLLEDNKAIMVDWKTGKEIDDDSQLKLMAAILFLHKPHLKDIYASFFYTKNKKSSFIHIKSDDLPNIWAEFMPRVKRLQYAVDHDEFPAKPSGLCRKWCCVDTCPHHGE